MAVMPDAMPSEAFLCGIAIMMPPASDCARAFPAPSALLSAAAGYFRVSSSRAFVFLL